MKRSTYYTLGFILFVIIMLLNISIMSKRHIDVEEKCVKLENINDSLQVEIDTINRK